MNNRTVYAEAAHGHRRIKDGIGCDESTIATSIGITQVMATDRDEVRLRREGWSQAHRQSSQFPFGCVARQAIVIPSNNSVDARR